MMNDRINQLIKQSYVTIQTPSGEDNTYFSQEKFAELIVRECVDKMLNSDDEHFMKLEGWDLGGPNHNAWTRGVLDSVAVVREHFGVE